MQHKLTDYFAARVFVAHVPGLANSFNRYIKQFARKCFDHRKLFEASLDILKGDSNFWLPDWSWHNYVGRMRQRLTLAGTVENNRNQNLGRLKQRFETDGSVATKRLNKEQFMRAFEELNTASPAARAQAGGATAANGHHAGVGADTGAPGVTPESSPLSPGPSRKNMWQTYAAAIFDVRGKGS